MEPCGTPAIVLIGNITLQKTEDSKSRPKASNFTIHSLWFRVSNVLERHMITMFSLSSFFNCSLIFLSLSVKMTIIFSKTC